MSASSLLTHRPTTSFLTCRGFFFPAVPLDVTPLAALGGVLLSVLIILLIIWLVRWKKQKKKYEEEETPNEIRYEQQQQQQSYVAMTQQALINGSNDGVCTTLLIFDVHA